MSRLPPDLHRLAHAHGVKVGYVDGEGRRVLASPDVLLEVLAVLGVHLSDPQDAARALAAHRAEAAATLASPVIVAWDGQAQPLDLHLPVDTGAQDGVRLALVLESGQERTLEWPVRAGQPLGTLAGADPDRPAALVRRFQWPDALPLGRHTGRVEVGQASARVHIVSAPRRAPTRAVEGRRWGTFLPTFALWDQEDWGVGSYRSLQRLVEWTAQRGGGAVATLPLLPSFLGRAPFEPSPYAPATRTGWNELYVDLAVTPEWDACPAARALVARPAWQREREALLAMELLDYRRLDALRAPVLALLAAQCLQHAGPRQAACMRFLQAHPHVLEYARFRAAGEVQDAPWPCWPADWQDGRLPPDAVEQSAVQVHAYGQFLAYEQLGQLSRMARERGVDLVLDLPLGVHADSFDVWRHPRLFAKGASVGAPPDAFFTQGQDWGFPPLLPAAQRAEGHATWAATIRHQLEHASVLRVDHILGLHRLYWIPHGRSAKEGAYVANHPTELYAHLCLAAHETGATLVGEDLGTVPAGVRPAMAEHGLQRLYVFQFDAASGQPGPGPSPGTPVAGLNTHDLPTFAAYLQGLDVDDLLELGLHTPASAAAERAARRGLRADLSAWLQAVGLAAGQGGEEHANLLSAALRWLARGPAPLQLINLEDLWGEVRPVNVPGTHRERPNWRRRARHSLERLVQLPEVSALLAEVHQLRKAAPFPPEAAASMAADGRALSRFNQLDLVLLGLGRHLGLMGKLGAHSRRIEGGAGVHFGVWAPAARAVAVAIDRAQGPPRTHDLLPVASTGLWEGFVRGARPGDAYCYRFIQQGGVSEHPDPACPTLPNGRSRVPPRESRRSTDSTELVRWPSSMTTHSPALPAQAWSPTLVSLLLSSAHHTLVRSRAAVLQVHTRRVERLAAHLAALAGALSPDGAQPLPPITSTAAFLARLRTELGARHPDTRILIE